MRTIAIIKSKNEEYKGKILRVQILPQDKSDDEIKAEIERYNKENETKIASSETVSDELFSIIEFLIKDRKLDINRHIDAISDLQDDISDIDDYLRCTVRELRDRLYKSN